MGRKEDMGSKAERRTWIARRQKWGAKIEIGERKESRDENPERSVKQEEQRTEWSAEGESTLEYRGYQILEVDIRKNCEMKKGGDS